MALVFWPGIPMYDTVAQYGQVLSNDVDDWHPPVMVRLWQLLQPFGTGTEPMFVLQVALYAVGFALIVSALVRNGRPRSAIAAAAIAMSPLLLGWQMVVLKDAQMVGAMLAALGIIVHYRLANRRVHAAAVASTAVLLIYATLVRANALFATVPLAVLLLPRPISLVLRGAVIVGAILVLLAVEPLINHRLFAASSSGVAKSQPLFDLAAISVAARSPVPPFTATQRAQLIRKHCVKAFFWDPVADPSACGPDTDAVRDLDERALYLDLGRGAVAHPLAYLTHRLEHWNSTERWLVQPGLIDAAPPDDAEPNDEGLAAPASPLMPVWQRLAGWEARTPFGWPIFWTAAGLLLLPGAWRRRTDPSAAIAVALLVSTLALEASFLVVSIASDLRYHLWSMAAVPLALVLLSADFRWTRRRWIGAGTVLVAVAAAGVVTRTVLPKAPSNYQAMLRAPLG